MRNTIRIVNESDQEILIENDAPVPEIKMQEKTVTPTQETQIITADTGYKGLEKVTVNKVPTETLEVTLNGTYKPSNGKFFDSVEVNCDSPDALLDGSMTSYRNEQFTNIRPYAFAGSGIIDCDLPNVTIVHNEAFSESALKNINMPNLTVIYGDGTFRDTNIEYLSLPNLETFLREEGIGFGIHGVGKNFASRCKSLLSVNLPKITFLNDNAFIRCEKLQEVKIPNLQQTISNVFSECVSLERVEFPLLTSLGSSMFSRCKNLKYVNLPLLQSSEPHMFSYCDKLTDIIMPNCTDCKFYMCNECNSLEKVDFPKCRSISSSAFNSCGKLSTVILSIDNVVSLDNRSAFQYTPISSGTGYIYVPKSLVEQYKVATNWTVYANQIRAIEDYPEIYEETE